MCVVSRGGRGFFNALSAMPIMFELVIWEDPLLVPLVGEKANRRFQPKTTYHGAMTGVLRFFQRGTTEYQH